MAKKEKTQATATVKISPEHLNRVREAARFNGMHIHRIIEQGIDIRLKQLAESK